ncbi:hypothetical protein [Streptomyces avermitilis]
MERRRRSHPDDRPRTYRAEQFAAALLLSFVALPLLIELIG